LTFIMNSVEYPLQVNKMDTVLLYSLLCNKIVH